MTAILDGKQKSSAKGEAHPAVVGRAGAVTPLLADLLVVDDDESVRYMLAHLLGRQGYSVTAADGAVGALAELKAHRFDVVLCDVRMPGMDGLDLLGRILGEHPDITVIMMSAYGSVDQALAAIKAGAYDYISKPFKKDEVVFVLRKAEERELLRRENRRLRDRLGREVGVGELVGESSQMQAVFKTIRKVAGYKSTALITGESGTGKELAARSLHALGAERNGPFVAINCGAIPEHLLESELFGHRKGAFTHAVRDKNGLFVEADGGTLFLDEIGELPLDLQVKLLRVLQEGVVRRLGDTKTIKVDARIVAATARDLPAMVSQGTFRDDLYYRIAVLPIEMPPLRNHREDIPVLVEHFREKIGKQMGRSAPVVSAAALKALVEYDWPGNVRELENTIHHAVVMAEGDEITVADLPEKLQVERSASVEYDLASAGLSIKKATRLIEARLIRRALEQTQGNRTQAAKLLEISHRALLYKMKEYGVDL